MEMSAYDGNQWRVERLQKAARIACAIMGTTTEQLAALVSKLQDHKGELVVTWKHKHTPQQEIAFMSAWRECGEYVVHHQTEGVF